MLLQRLLLDHSVWDKAQDERIKTTGTLDYQLISQIQQRSKILCCMSKPSCHVTSYAQQTRTLRRHAHAHSWQNEFHVVFGK
jgi:hypothetical protein